MSQVLTRSALLVAAAVVLVAGRSSRGEWRVEVRFAPQARPKAFTGRVYLFFNRPVPQGATQREPRLGPNWFTPEPFVARDVTGWKPDDPLEFSSADESLLAFPAAAGALGVEGGRVQAVARFHPWERTVGTGPGNGYSPVVAMPPANSEDPVVVQLTIDRLVAPRAFDETKWSRLLSVRSESLSRFYGRDATLNAAVLLPASYYDQPERRYPAIFSIPGFGGTHFEGRRTAPVEENNPGDVEFLRVTLDPSCPLGHHVFADSENNGPVGTALVTELIPELDRRFRTVAAPTARFLTGHSSGGWSSLWLQVAWPDVFGGVWSTSPDPVDFRDFQRIDLYRPGENMYVDGRGDERPIARRNGKVALWYRGFSRMEHVLGPGGQLHSFEAVFSPRGPDGRPRLLWDRSTGAIDPDVARAWEKYDIRLVLERNWGSLGPKLAGKLHVVMGEEDTFYLEGATRLLKESLAKLDSDATVELVPGKDHGTVLSRELFDRIRREMAEAFLRNHPRP